MSGADGRDHGGDLAGAVERFRGERFGGARFGGGIADWLDLSTGVNRRPWPGEGEPVVSAAALRALPGRELFARVEAAARAAWSVHPAAAILPTAGAQAAIQFVPRLRKPGRVAVVSPTYNEHAAAFAAEGWSVEPVAAPDALRGADAGVVVNPNNPDGRHWSPEALDALSAEVGLLIVDESFGDPLPALSLLPRAPREGRVILRSFGKFHGLAGLRLGFAIGAPADIARLRAMAGPWAVSGPALEIGAEALSDRACARAMTAQLDADAARLDALAAGAGWRLVGGTPLFRTYGTPDAGAAQARLAAARIWSRIFPWSPDWLRLGMPGPEPEWARLAAALA